MNYSTLCTDAAWPCLTIPDLWVLVLVLKIFQKLFLKAKSHTLQGKKIKSWDQRFPVKFGSDLKLWVNFCAYVCTVAAWPRLTNPDLWVLVLVLKIFQKQFLKAKIHTCQGKKRIQSWDQRFPVKFDIKVKKSKSFFLANIINQRPP